MVAPGQCAIHVRRFDRIDPSIRPIPKAFSRVNFRGRLFPQADPDAVFGDRDGGAIGACSHVERRSQRPDRAPAGFDLKGASRIRRDGEERFSPMERQPPSLSARVTVRTSPTAVR